MDIKIKTRIPKSEYVAPLAENQTVPTPLKGTPFENYRLIGEHVQTSNGKLDASEWGAQVDWVVRSGEATVIDNPHIESSIETKIILC